MEKKNCSRFKITNIKSVLFLLTTEHAVLVNWAIIMMVKFLEDVTCEQDI